MYGPLLPWATSNPYLKIPGFGIGPWSGPTWPQALFLIFSPPPGRLARREVEAIKELQVGLDQHANENANLYLGKGWRNWGVG